MIFASYKKAKIWDIPCVQNTKSSGASKKVVTATNAEGWRIVRDRCMITLRNSEKILLNNTFFTIYLGLSKPYIENRTCLEVTLLFITALIILNKRLSFILCDYWHTKRALVSYYAYYKMNVHRRMRKHEYKDIWGTRLFKLPSWFLESLYDRVIFSKANGPSCA